jgi:anti-sigma factor ChrR (cupin superfamily)
LAQGSHFPRHAHHGTEEAVVLTGEVSIGGVALEEGDDLFTSTGEEHDVAAISDAVIFASGFVAQIVAQAVSLLVLGYAKEDWQSHIPPAQLA